MKSKNLTFSCKSHANNLKKKNEKLKKKIAPDVKKISKKHYKNTLQLSMCKTIFHGKFTKSRS